MAHPGAARPAAAPLAPLGAMAPPPSAIQAPDRPFAPAPQIDDAPLQEAAKIWQVIQSALSTINEYMDKYRKILIARDNQLRVFPPMLEQREQKNVKLQYRIQQQASEIATVRRDFARQGEVLAVRTRELFELRGRVGNLERMLNGKDMEIAELRKSLDWLASRARQEVEVTQSEAEDLKRRAEGARREVEAAQEEATLAQLRAEKARQEAEFSRESAERSRHEEEAARAEAEAARAAAELGQLGAQLPEVEPIAMPEQEAGESPEMAEVQEVEIVEEPAEEEPGAGAGRTHRGRGVSDRDRRKRPRR
jgi:chromosome segregation ATPase